MTLYLLDANVLINAHNDYYPIDVVPEFWEFLRHHAEAGTIKMPVETYEEVKFGAKSGVAIDPLERWMKNKETRTALLLPGGATPTRVQDVLRRGYELEIDDVNIARVGKDPFLISYALPPDVDRCVVTTEASSPKKQGANRKIPDVCASLSIPCCNTFAMLRALKFSTGWRR